MLYGLKSAGISHNSHRLKHIHNIRLRCTSQVYGESLDIPLHDYIAMYINEH